MKYVSIPEKMVVGNIYVVYPKLDQSSLQLPYLRVRLKTFQLRFGPTIHQASPKFLLCSKSNRRLIGRLHAYHTYYFSFHTAFQGVAWKGMWNVWTFRYPLFAIFMNFWFSERNLRRLIKKPPSSKMWNAKHISCFFIFRGRFMLFYNKCVARHRLYSSVDWLS